MLILRLQRIGKKKNPTYRLIVSEKTKDTQAGTLENLGIYNPVVSPKVIQFNAERINYWISKGAQLSTSVNNLLVQEGIIKGKKEKSVFLSKKRQEKMGKKKAEVASAKAEAEKKATEKKLAEEEAKKQAAEAEKAEAEKKATEKKLAEEEAKKQAAEAEKAEAEKKAVEEAKPADETQTEVGEAPVVEENK